MEFSTAEQGKCEVAACVSVSEKDSGGNSF